MVEKVKGYMEKWNMIPQGGHVFIGVSGGADSVCLCLLLKELSSEMHFSLEVIHVEHGIRGEDSRRDAKFVENMCKRLEILCHVEHVSVPSYAKEWHLSEEEAARILRYQIFVRYAKERPGSRIALAHHMEDNAETMLFQMIRGSGIDGLCGIHPVRLGERKETYIRPLLSCSRQEIEEFLRKREQEYCLDATNEDITYSRNRIRHNVIPELAMVNEKAVLHMNQTAEYLGELREYLDMLTDEVLERAVRRDRGRIFLDVVELRQLPQILRMRVLHRMAAETAGAKKDIGKVHLDAIASLLDKQTGRRIDLPYGLCAVREYQEIVLCRRKEESQTALSVEITREQLETLRTGEDRQPLVIEVQGVRFSLRVFPFDGKIGEIPRKMYTKWLDYDKIKNSFSIRNRRPKDFFVYDHKGHRKKLSDYFITEKIPADRRDQYLLVAQGAQVLWIVGGRMGASALVEETTGLVLEIHAEPVVPESGF